MPPRLESRLDRLMKLVAETAPTEDADPRWTPQAGPQTALVETPAFETLYGGSAGGGKTSGLLGLAATQHTNAIIFRREYVQLSELIRGSRAILRDAGSFNKNEMLWSFTRGGNARSLRFGAMAGPDDWEKFQGRTFDLIAFDELAHFSRDQYIKIQTWARTTDPAQRVRIVAASNPPATAEGEWMIRRWAPWVDPQHRRPAESGEIRHFITIEDDDIEVDGPGGVRHDGRTYTPVSRTFIRARITDNSYLMGTGYLERLQSLPAAWQRLMLEGDFIAGLEDDEWQLIPTAWVLAAEERWRHGRRPDTPLTALGVDVARGGRDATILAPVRGAYVHELIHYPGETPPDGSDVAAKVFSTLVDHDGLGALVVIDANGVGASPYDFLRKVPRLRVYGAVGSRRATAHDESHQLRFANTRSWYWWHVRELLDPKNGRNLALPPDPRLRADLCAPRWAPRAGGVIQVETKEDVVKRLGRSPDRGDAVVLALAPVGRIDRTASRPIIMGGGVDVGGRDRLRVSAGTPVAAGNGWVDDGRGRDRRRQSRPVIMG